MDIGMDTDVRCPHALDEDELRVTSYKLQVTSYNPTPWMRTGFACVSASCSVGEEEHTFDSVYLPVSPCISLYLPVSPCISLSRYLLLSPAISLYLPLSPAISRYLPLSPKHVLHMLIPTLALKLTST